MIRDGFVLKHSPVYIILKNLLCAKRAAKLIYEGRNSLSFSLKFFSL